MGHTMAIGINTFGWQKNQMLGNWFGEAAKTALLISEV
jgi:hypothetical protein